MTAATSPKLANDQRKIVESSKKTVLRTLPADRPWMPMQIMVSGFLFGPLAATVIMAVNFTRLGKPAKFSGSLARGLLLTAVLSFVYACLPPGLLQVCGLLNIVAGAVFAGMQRSDFNAWKEKNWDKLTTERYKPNRIGRLFGIGIVCLLVQASICLGLSMVLRLSM